MRAAVWSSGRPQAEAPEGSKELLAAAAALTAALPPAGLSAEELQKTVRESEALLEHVGALLTAQQTPPATARLQNPPAGEDCPRTPGKCSQAPVIETTQRLRRDRT